jgi:hypothetical protein
MILLFDGFTLYLKNAFIGSSLYAWILIETFLSKLWEDHVKSLERSREDKTSLRNFNLWTSYHYIEMFAIMDKIDTTSRNHLHNLRKKRNSIVHDRKEVNREDAFSCLSTASNILRNRVKNPGNPLADIS